MREERRWNRRWLNAQWHESFRLRSNEGSIESPGASSPTHLFLPEFINISQIIPILTLTCDRCYLENWRSSIRRFQGNAIQISIKLLLFTNYHLNMWILDLSLVVWAILKPWSKSVPRYFCILSVPQRGILNEKYHCSRFAQPIYIISSSLERCFHLP